MITLDNIELPGDLMWVDETQWSPVAQSETHTLSGSLLIETDVKQAGRPITLAGSEDSCWVTRETVLALLAFSYVPEKSMTLTLGDGRTFTVMFRRDGSASGIEANPIIERVPPLLTDWNTIILQFVEI